MNAGNKLNQAQFEFYLETSQLFKLILSFTRTHMHTYTLNQQLYSSCKINTFKHLTDKVEVIKHPMSELLCKKSFPSNSVYINITSGREIQFRLLLKFKI